MDSVTREAGTDVLQSVFKDIFANPSLKGVHPSGTLRCVVNRNDLANRS
jgi:hypothetical protein